MYIELNRKSDTSLYTLIDIEDLPLMNNFEGAWCASYDPDHNGYYAKAVIRNGKRNGKTIYTSLTLHKYLMNPKHGNVIDHKDHDSLNNRRYNLREIKHNSNLEYRKSRNKNNKSGYRNVFWNNGAGKWEVSISKNYKRVFCAQFDDLAEAGAVAEQARKKYYGEYAGLN